MKKLALSLALLFAAGIAMAQQPETKAPAPKAGAKTDDQAGDKAKAGARKFHAVPAEIVSTDVEKMTVTFKADGAEKTAPVSNLAKYRLAKLKPGDKVLLSCKDVGGEHKEIVAIRPATAGAGDQ